MAEDGATFKAFGNTPRKNPIIPSDLYLRIIQFSNLKYK